MILLYSFILFLIVIFQVTSVSYISIFSAAPDLVLIFVLFFVIFKEWKEAIILAFLAGIFVDLFSDFSFGMAALAFIFTAKIVSFLSRNIFSKPNVVIMGIVGAGGTLVYKLILIGEIKFLKFSPFYGIGYNLLPSLFGEMIYNTILMIGIYLILKKLIPKFLYK